MAARYDDPDVLIAGGGPAGSAAAIACAERGLSVVLVERDELVRERPGETLHPGIEPLLRQLGIAERLPEVVGARHEGVWIDWAGDLRFERFGEDAEGPWRGFQVNRVGFHRLLLARARELGVDVRQPCPVLDLDYAEGQPSRVSTGAGPVTCRIVVDATGGARWLSRKLGLHSRTYSPPLVTRFGYAQGSCPERDEAPLLQGDEAGWTWTARVRPGLYQWVRVNLAAGQIDATVPHAFRYLAPLGPPRGADVTWRMSEAGAGPGWFIVGDAAAMLDPTSSHGVLRALMCGMMAGHLATAIVKQGVPEKAAADAFKHWLREWFLRDVAKLKSFYGAIGADGFGDVTRVGLSGSA